MITVMKLLFLSFRLIFATTHPKRQERISTIAVTIRKSMIPQITLSTVAPATNQYTNSVGSITTPEYIAPSR